MDRSSAPAPRDAPVTLSIRIARPNEFKEPDDWVTQGRAESLSPGGITHTIYMGIDFGTAYAKGSIGFGGDIFIVDWDGVKGGPERFTLPGEFSVLRDGSCVLGRSPQATRVASDLKRPLLDGTETANGLVDATAFLALIMRYIRGWWFHRHGGLNRNRRLEWNVNLGAPTTPWQDTAIRASYERVVKAAWALSARNTSISMGEARSALERAGSLARGNLLGVEIVPEFVAQIASYSRSPQRQRDLHLLVDVGAGTVDVATFNVHRDPQTEDDRFPIFCASVTSLGTHFLMARRFASRPTTPADQWDDGSSVPSADEFSQTTGVAAQSIRQVDQEHTAEVARKICSVLQETKRNRYRLSPNWQAGIRVFLGGGGSGCEVFQKAVDEASRLVGVPLHPIRLPLPENLKAPGLLSDRFHRVSVAFGLGIDAYNLGTIVPMAEVDDDVAVPLPERQGFDWDDG